MAIDGVPWLHWLPHPRISEEKGVYEPRWWTLEKAGDGSAVNIISRQIGSAVIARLVAVVAF